MVDGVILVVDAFEGCMPQTRFVLKKALGLKKTPLVVVNKIDRDGARPQEVIDEVLDLFIELGADDDQIDFPVVFASAKDGYSSLDPNVRGRLLTLFLNTYHPRQVTQTALLKSFSHLLNMTIMLAESASAELREVQLR